MIVFQLYPPFPTGPVHTQNLPLSLFWAYNYSVYTLSLSLLLVYLEYIKLL